MSGPWVIRRQWVASSRAEADQERERLEHTARLHLGRALLALLRRPWSPGRVLEVFRALVVPHPGAVQGPFDALDRAVPPLPVELAPDWTSAAEQLADRRDLRERWRSVQRIRGSLAFRLGTALVEGTVRRRLAALAGLWRQDDVERPSPDPPWESSIATRRPGAREPVSRPEAGGPDVHHLPEPPEAEPFEAGGRETWTAGLRPASVDSAAPVIDTPNLPTWSCLAPPWLESMLAYEAVPSTGPGRALLVGLDSATLPAALDLAPEIPTAVWLLESRLPPASEPLLSRATRVYAADAALAAQLTAQLGRDVPHLPPAIAPRLHNPIGWWSGRAGISAEWEPALPPRWRRLVDVARGLAPASSAPLSPAPGWAATADASAWPRFAALRNVHEHHTLARRLARVSRDLDLPSPPLPLVSLVIVTNRRDHLANVFSAVSAQVGVPLELVLVVHGDARLAAEARARADDLSIPARVELAPAHQSLAECRQQASDAAAGDVQVRMDDDDLYGPRYAADLALALSFSGAGVATKVCCVTWFAASHRMVVLSPGWEFRYCRAAMGCAVAVRREVLDELRWRGPPGLSDHWMLQDCAAAGIPALSADRFHYVYVRHGGGNTWVASEQALLGWLSHQVLPAGARAEDFRP